MPRSSVDAHVAGRARRRHGLRVRQLRGPSPRARRRSQPSPIQKEVTQVDGGPDHLTVATFNVENLAPDNPQSKFDGLANVFVNNLGRARTSSRSRKCRTTTAPTDDGSRRLDTTLDLLNAALAAGGPRYAYAGSNPGERSGRRAAGRQHPRRLRPTAPTCPAFRSRPGRPAARPTAKRSSARAPRRRSRYNPGRVDPTELGLGSSRKPLAGEFLFNGHGVRGREPLRLEAR